jgi:hypothetical protein
MNLGKTKYSLIRIKSESLISVYQWLLSIMVPLVAPNKDGNNPSMVQHNSHLGR